MSGICEVPLAFDSELQLGQLPGCASCVDQAMDGRRTKCSPWKWCSPGGTTTTPDTTIKLEDHMSLECIYPSPGILTQAEWFKISSSTSDRESMVIFRPLFGTIVRESYVGRIYFLNSTSNPKDMTLAFYNATEVDVGLYICLLHTFPSGSWEKMLEVVQTESYFEPPGPFDRYVLANPGEEVTLSCELQDVKPVETVVWEKIQPQQIDLLTLCNVKEGRGSLSKYRRPIYSTCNQRLISSFISINHLNINDSGVYRCSFKVNTGENETYLARLTVTTRNEGKWSQGQRGSKWGHDCWALVSVVLSYGFM
ncbi:PREDICTED: CD226 antigen [Elephantulus edwardii]|uniref:CD226 antigen n=1 Tax=Elephantulus edwardii TaxID=28737 RepID=UPI0003F0B5D7|nr:PREDICTED: CD226 antigen [Elephantulus edwardii]